jgi:DNA-binding NarL/FixJ family response regulator
MKGNGDTVLVSDSCLECRALISDLLGRVGYRTIEAKSGQEVLSTVRQKPPALVLLEVERPGVSGYELCHELKQEYGQDLPIILLSETRTEPSDRVAGLLLGADDYVVKPFDQGELLARMRRLLNHRSEAPKALIEKERPDQGVRAPVEKERPDQGVRAPVEEERPNQGVRAPVEEERPNQGASLTNREREILALLAAGLRSNAIAKNLFISPKTVSTHIQHILAKLDVHSRAEAVAVAFRDGLVDKATSLELVVTQSEEPEAHASANRARPH